MPTALHLQFFSIGTVQLAVFSGVPYFARAFGVRRALPVTGTDPGHVRFKGVVPRAHQLAPVPSPPGAFLHFQRILSGERNQRFSGFVLNDLPGVLSVLDHGSGNFARASPGTSTGPVPAARGAVLGNAGTLLLAQQTHVCTGVLALAQ